MPEFLGIPLLSNGGHWDSPIALLELVWYASAIGLWMWWQLRQ